MECKSSTWCVAKGLPIYDQHSLYLQNMKRDIVHSSVEDDLQDDDVPIPARFQLFTPIARLDTWHKR